MLTAALDAKQLSAMNETSFLQFAFDTVAKRELHEVEEWLRLDGQPLRNPTPRSGVTASWGTTRGSSCPST